MWHDFAHAPAVGCGCPDEVAEGFRAAIEIFRRYHAPWEEAGALLFWSRVLFAASVIAQSVRKSSMPHLRSSIKSQRRQWNERLQADVFRFLTLDSHAAPITSADGSGSNVFRKEGDYWTISFRGSIFRLRDTIGMHYISRLVANPGIDFSAQDLRRARTQRTAQSAGRQKAAVRPRHWAHEWRNAS